MTQNNTSTKDSSVLFTYSNSEYEGTDQSSSSSSSSQSPIFALPSENNKIIPIEDDDNNVSIPPPETTLEEFLQEFPVNRSSAVFANRQEMEETLSTLTWGEMKRRFHWGHMKGRGNVDYLLLRDDIKKKNVNKSRLLRFGVKGIHYFDYFCCHDKSICENQAVEYFKQNCICNSE